MTLSDIVREVIAEHFGVDFATEQQLGDANRADFVGNCPWLGEVRVELERCREDPVNNVAKAWRQADGNAAEESFTLVQVFSGYYLSRPAKRQNAEFVGRKMCECAARRGEMLRYVPISFDFVPQRSQANTDLPVDDAARVREQLTQALEQAIPRPV